MVRAQKRQPLTVRLRGLAVRTLWTKLKSLRPLLRLRVLENKMNEEKHMKMFCSRQSLASIRTQRRQSAPLLTE